MRWLAERPGRGSARWLAAFRMLVRGEERWWAERLERSAEPSWATSRIITIDMIIGLTTTIGITASGRCITKRGWWRSGRWCGRDGCIDMMMGARRRTIIGGNCISQNAELR